MLAITGGYAAILTAFFIFLSTRVVVYRRAKSVSLGDSGDPVLLSRIRAQGNFSEYAPLGLLLVAIAELQGTGAVWLHLSGGLLLVGRLLHGINFTFRLGQMPMRSGGMVLTVIAMALGAILALPL
jgi:uncharacterized protein